MLEFEEAEYHEACTKIALSSGQSEDDNGDAGAATSEDFLKKEELRLYHIRTRDAAVERVGVRKRSGLGTLSTGTDNNEETVRAQPHMHTDRIGYERRSLRVDNQTTKHAPASARLAK